MNCAAPSAWKSRQAAHQRRHHHRRGCPLRDSLHLSHPAASTVRVARWDLSSVDLVDPRRGTYLATLLPVDKERNADRRRRASSIRRWRRPRACPGAGGYRAALASANGRVRGHGLPPAYVPHDTTVDRNDGGNDTEHEHHEPEEHP